MSMSNATESNATARLTVGKAKDTIAALLREGVRCPCCGQWAQAYRRTIHASMAAALIAVYNATAFHHTDGRHAGVRFADVIDDRRQIADAAKLRYWGLITGEQDETRTDGGRRGLWRVTFHGYQFVRGEVTVERYAVVYDGELIGLEGPLVSIRDCLGDGFDYEKLLRGVA